MGFPSIKQTNPKDLLGAFLACAKVWMEHAVSLGLDVPKSVEKVLEALRALGFSRRQLEKPMTQMMDPFGMAALGGWAPRTCKW